MRKCSRHNIRCENIFPYIFTNFYNKYNPLLYSWRESFFLLVCFNFPIKLTKYCFININSQSGPVPGELVYKICYVSKLSGIGVLKTHQVTFTCDFQQISECGYCKLYLAFREFKSNFPQGNPGCY